jgi:hypothetical protein
MLTSAPLDDWWHAAYGLDVEILSPPHVLLAAGILAIILGAALTVLSEQNRAAAEREARAYSAMFAYLAGIGVAMVGVLATEHTYRIYLHSSGAYQVAGAAFPLLLVAAGRAGGLRWPATAAAAAYTALTAAMVWILPLFPGEPLLGPIHTAVTRMVPPDFPLALVAPAAVMDMAMRRAGHRNDWRLSVALGVVFAVVFLVVEWFVASLILSPYGRNWFFAGHVLDYMTPADSYSGRGEFYPGDANEAAMRRGLGVYVLLAIASSRLGLWLGGWMRRVQR